MDIIVDRDISLLGDMNLWSDERVF